MKKNKNKNKNQEPKSKKEDELALNDSGLVQKKGNNVFENEREEIDNNINQPKQNETKKKLSNGAIIGIVASFLSILIIAISAYLWISNKVENRIDKEIKPYRYLLEATSLLQNENYDFAVNKFDDAFEILHKENLKDEALAAIILPYLEAIALSYDPEKHKHRFDKIEKIVLKELPPSENTERHFGWAYLSFGELGKAIKAFDKSLKLSTKKSKLSEIALANIGLYYCMLAEGKIQKAKEHLFEAMSHDPELFDVKAYVKEFKEQKEDYFLEDLKIKYQPFEKSYNELFKGLEKNKK